MWTWEEHGIRPACAEAGAAERRRVPTPIDVVVVSEEPEGAGGGGACAGSAPWWQSGRKTSGMALVLVVGLVPPVRGVGMFFSAVNRGGGERDQAG